MEGFSCPLICDLAHCASMGAFLKCKRILVGLTQEAVGRAIRPNSPDPGQLVSILEKDKREVTISDVRRLSKVLGCLPEEFEDALEHFSGVND